MTRNDPGHNELCEGQSRSAPILIAVGSGRWCLHSRVQFPVTISPSRAVPLNVLRLCVDYNLQSLRRGEGGVKQNFDI